MSVVVVSTREGVVLSVYITPTAELTASHQTRPPPRLITTTAFDVRDGNSFRSQFIIILFSMIKHLIYTVLYIYIYIYI